MIFQGIKYFAEGCHAERLGDGCGGGVRDIPVNTDGGSREERALFGGLVAEGDDIIDGIRQKFVEVFGAVLANVDVTLAHGSNRHWMDKTRVSARTCNIHPVSG